LIVTGQVFNEKNGEMIAEKVVFAHTWLSRLKGLLGTKSLSEDAGMWLKPCNGIHTMWMRYAIDVIYLTQENKISKLVSSIKPNRFCNGVKGTVSVLELKSGQIEKNELLVGDQLIFKAE
jgi:uncharacterized membrane protein (UPF0127 family)